MSYGTQAVQFYYAVVSIVKLSCEGMFILFQVVLKQKKIVLKE